MTVTEPRSNTVAAQAGPDPLRAVPAVATSGLTKRFRGGQVAVDHIDMSVPRGAVYGFLGPNGSGKTTTIRMLLGLIAPTDGSARLFGEARPGRVLHRVGALVEGPAFHLHLSGAANLARLDAADRTADPRTARARIGRALERVGLSAAAGKRVRAYSLGMKQRLGIAAALLRPRDMLVLDEPTNGLDPQGTREVRSLVDTLADDGTTVLISSHLLSEVEHLCTHVGVMHVGKLLWQGTLAALREEQEARVRVETSAPAKAVTTLEELGFTGVSRQGNEVTAPMRDREPEAVSAALAAADVPIRGFAIDAPTLEEMFVHLTGEGFDVSG